MGIADRFRALFKPTKLDFKSRFDIVRSAISGTMSQFYQVKDKDTGEIFGLKICDVDKTDFFENRFTGLDKPLEGEIALQMEHPLIVKTIEHGKTTEGEQYVLMEFLDGFGLNEVIKKRMPEVEGKRLPLIRDMATALQFVHDQGFIHRDVCPRNFITTRDFKQARLIDFGLTVPATKHFMQPGNRTGTPNYMAPEIVRRKATDHRLDIFAFGVTVFQLCTFELPWSSGDVTGKAALNHDSHPPSDISKLRPDLHPKLADTIKWCISVKPDDRPKSLNDVLDRLKKLDSELA